MTFTDVGTTFGEAISTYEYMRAKIARLQAENALLKQGNAQLHRELAVQEQQANHWYMK